MIISYNFIRKKAIEILTRLGKQGSNEKIEFVVQIYYGNYLDVPWDSSTIILLKNCFILRWLSHQALRKNNLENEKNKHFVVPTTRFLGKIGDLKAVNVLLQTLENQNQQPSKKANQYN